MAALAVTIVRAGVPNDRAGRATSFSSEQTLSFGRPSCEWWLREPAD